MIAVVTGLLLPMIIRILQLTVTNNVDMIMVIVNEGFGPRKTRRKQSAKHSIVLYPTYFPLYGLAIGVLRALEKASDSRTKTTLLQNILVPLTHQPTSFYRQSLCLYSVPVCFSSC